MARKGIFFPLKDAALRDDVHALGELVGEVLKDQCGQALFDLVEGDRQAAIGRRQGEPEASVELVVRAQGRTPREAQELIRAFTTWFQVVNLAEKVHRVRRRRQYMNDSSTPQPGGLEECFGRLAARGMTLEQVVALLGRLSIEPVFTAHPTESTRRTLLRQQQRIARLLIGQLDTTRTPAERRATIERVRTELTTGWQTAGKAVVPELLHFGSWVGGDMDGHPDVHAKTIRESCLRHHQLIVNRYFLETQALAERLSQSANRTAVSAGVTARIEQYRSLIPAAQSATPASHDRMPYRVFLGQVAERLRATYDGRAGHYERVEQLIDDLELIAGSLAANHGQHAGLFHVRRMLRRVRTFGFHLATLDVRQNAAVHREIVGRALGEDGWLERTAEERRLRLGTALERDESPSADLDAAAKRALWVFEAMEYCGHRYGRASVGSYVVSQARDVDDLLSVLLLAQWAGLADGPDAVIPLDVAPLFESAESLASAGDIVRRLLADPVYRSHLRTRGDRQVVMIGYSDSNKSVGIAASRWLLRRAQEAMVEACDAAGVELLVFHGRGGSVSVGGGRIEALVKGLPPGALRGRLRVTEQGESINERYGQRAIALRSFEQAVHSVAITAAAGRRGEDLDPRWLEAMALLAEASRAVYRARIHDDASFEEYFQAVTPVDVIERMQIGSRPLTRATGSGVEALRSIPWMFAWSQSRHMLPGWYGVGSGLQAVVERHGADLLGEMYARWPFASALLDGVEVVLAKADMGIAEFYDQLAAPQLQYHANDVQREFGLAERHILNVKGCARLLDSEPTLQRSIRLRNPYVDPIHLMQVDLLKRWREGGREDRETFDALVASVNGIAQGLQGSG